MEEKLLYKLHLGKALFEGCHRADFLDELVKSLPGDAVRFGKYLDDVEDSGDDAGEKKLVLRFSDGTVDEAVAGTCKPRLAQSLSATNLATFALTMVARRGTQSHWMRRDTLPHPPAHLRGRRCRLVPALSP